MTTLRLIACLASVASLAAVVAQAEPSFDFIASTAAHEHAARAYRAIWQQDGRRIVAALEARTCMRFPEAAVAATIDDAVSHSGGPEHPMNLRASYDLDVKRATLVHELGHRHLWQLTERLADLDGHRTLYLVLDRVWADVWGEQFAHRGVRTESSWRASYDYATAWEWARSLEAAERARLWNRLLEMNGFPPRCDAISTGASSLSAAPSGEDTKRSTTRPPQMRHPRS